MRPLWFGPADRSLYGVLHTPDDGRVRGTAVLVPPLGLEHVVAHRALRVAATELAGAGIATLRFDLDGTGDSAGVEADPDRLDAWLRSVRTAQDEMRVDGLPLVTVGLRMGGLLALHAGSQPRAGDRLVLWDACATGSSFLRRERAILTMSVNVGTHPIAHTEPGTVEGAGALYSVPTVTALRQLGIEPDDVTGWIEAAGADSVLVLTRSDRTDRAVDALRSVPSVSVVEVHDHDALLDASAQQSVVPTRTIAALRDWVDSALPSETRPAPAHGRDHHIVEIDGVDVTERAISLGSRGQFAIESSSSPDGPIVVLTNCATVHHIGSARVWVELARQLAARGIRAYRLDQRDLGDAAHALDTAPRFYSPESVEDIVDAVRSLSDDPSHDVSLVGLSAGSWSAAMAALETGARSLHLVNQWLWEVSPAPQGPGVTPPPPSLRLRTYRKLADRPTLARLAVRANSLASSAQPGWVRGAVISARPSQSSGRIPVALVRRGIPVTLLLSAQESERLHGRLTRAQRDVLERSPLFHLVVDAGIDHSLFFAYTRRVALTLMVERITAELAPSAPTIDLPAQESGASDRTPTVGG
jgi:alpha-beta hydrolase superfamily lysophospholipase